MQQETASVHNKWALLIGINKYPKLSKWYQLNGCVNDVELMESILRQQFGFPQDHITLLRDEEATRHGILKAMNQLVERVGLDDIVVVHYSGHGSQIVDREGDEPDGMDETILPHDTARRHERNQDITDDEIHDWLLHLTKKTSYITLIFDCCHSATLTRDGSGAQARLVEPDLRTDPAVLPPPLSPEARQRIAQHTSREVGPSDWLPLGSRYVLMAGCRDEELAFEYTVPESGTRYGALTYFLCQQLAKAQPGSTYRDVFEPARTQINALYPRQHPQLEGTRDRLLFGVQDVEPMRFVRVTACSEDTVHLAGGDAHGLSIGSEWDVYPPGTKQPGGNPLGRVAITAVSAVSSTAKILKRAPGVAISENARAVEAAHSYGPMQLSVRIEAPAGYEQAVADLSRKITDSPLLRVAMPGETAQAQAYLIPQRTSAGKDDPVPQLGSVKEPSWVVVDLDGKLAMPVRAVKAGHVVRNNLEKLARYRQTLALENPDPDHPLKNKVELLLERRGADGTWEEATPKEAGGTIFFESGDYLALTITNTHTDPVYVSVLDFGIMGGISLLHPIEGANEKLMPKRSIKIGKRDGDEVELYIPDAFPSVTDPADQVATEGVETFKLFVTSHPTDFSPLLQEGYRGGRYRDSKSLKPLEDLLNLTLTGEGTRELRRNKLQPDEAWTTKTLSFILRRRTSYTDLQPDGQPVEVDGIILRTPAVQGQARALPVQSPGTRQPGRTTTALETALEAEHAVVQKNIEIVDVRLRSLWRGEPELEVQVPDPGTHLGQFLLHIDEGGVLSWHFEDPRRRGAFRSRLARRTYVIRDRVVPPPGSSGTRGLIGAVGKKLLKVLVFPLIDPLIGKVGDQFAGRWEAIKRPYRIRTFTPENYRKRDAEGIDEAAWGRLSKGPALLFIHGTFSQAHTGFGDLPPTFIATLHERYEGRVFALDHFTLSHDPRQNAEWFLRQLPHAAALDLDLICHSRGGLVGRVLAEKPGADSVASQQVHVNKVIFVAAPNAGTALVDPRYMGSFVDTYTNLLNFIPDNPVLDVLEGVITVVKQLAVGTLKGLEGLQAMQPDGAFLQWLNRKASASGSRYFALGADYKPTIPGFKDFVTDRLLDTIFRTYNDLVVPTGSVYEPNGAAHFPIMDRHIFAKDDGIAHCDFFRSAIAQQKILDWLRT